MSFFKNSLSLSVYIDFLSSSIRLSSHSFAFLYFFDLFLFFKITSKKHHTVSLKYQVLSDLSSLFILDSVILIL